MLFGVIGCWSPEYVLTAYGFENQSTVVVACKAVLFVLAGLVAMATLRLASLRVHAISLAYAVYVLCSSLAVGSGAPRIGLFIAFLLVVYLVVLQLSRITDVPWWLIRAGWVAITINLFLTVLFVLSGRSAVTWHDQVPRFSSVLGHSPTGLFYLAMVLLMLFGALRLRSIRCVGGALIATLLSLSSQTRVAAFALALLWMVWGLYAGRRRGLSIIVSSVCAVLFIVVFFSYGRLDPRQALWSGTFLGRLVLWRWGLDMFFTSPLLGRGVGFTDEYLKDYLVTGAGAIHNEYVRILAEQGLLGAMFWSACCVRWVHGLKRHWASLTDSIQFLALGCGGVLIIVSFSDNLVHLYYSFTLLLTACVAVVQDRVQTVREAVMRAQIAGDSFYVHDRVVDARVVGSVEDR
jgi:O-antigen ligase